MGENRFKVSVKSGLPNKKKWKIKKNGKMEKWKEKKEEREKKKKVDRPRQKDVVHVTAMKDIISTSVLKNMRLDSPTKRSEGA